MLVLADSLASPFLCNHKSGIICCLCADPQAIQMGSYSRGAYHVYGSGQVWRRRYSNVVVNVLTELVLGLVFYAAVIWP